MDQLLVEKHVKYFTLCLNMFPSKYQDQDCNKLSLINFCLQGLELLGAISFPDDERQALIKFIYDSYYLGNGFRDTMNSSGAYGHPTISSTFFGLLNLIMLKDVISERIDRDAVMKFVSDCQIKEGDHKGSFSPTLGYGGSCFGETDLRMCYMALAIRRILKYDTTIDPKHDIDIQAVESYVLGKLNVDGGFGCLDNSDSHLGYTFCAIASLKLMGYDFKSQKWESSLNWILHRQINYPDALFDGQDVNHQDFGGFNGRENKAGDACYSWWSLGALSMLNHLQLANLDAAVQFLLLNQEHRIGGIAKNFESNPDPYHSYLAICTLALVKNSVHFAGSESLQEIDPLLTIPISSLAAIDSMSW